MVTTCDVAVIGLGVVGAATALAATRMGASVVGIDRYDPPHSLGSSHGETRITRLAVGEGPAFAPLVRRSHELWRELEAATGERCYVDCGGLVLGAPGATGQHGVGDFVEATIAVARAMGIEHEVLGAPEIRARFRVLATTNEIGYLEPEAGYLRAETCVATQLRLAERLGARLRTGTVVRRVAEHRGSVRVETDRDVILAASAVIAVGPWVLDLVPELAPHVTVEREVLFWFALDDGADLVAWERLPIFIWLHGPEVGELCYGFPAVGGADGGVKVATETFGAPTSPTAVVRDVDADEIRTMHRTHVAGRLRGLSTRCLRAETCLYTVAPDFGFTIDTLPHSARIVVASACSGHGFKHAPAVGEGAAALALGAPPPFDLSPFALARAGARAAPPDPA